MSRNMNIGPKSIFVMLHKLREAMGSTLDDGSELAGEVEVDGAYFGSGSARQTARPIVGNSAPIDNRRLVVVVARERHGRAIPWVVAREGAAVPTIRGTSPAERPFTPTNLASGTSCTPATR